MNHSNGQNEKNNLSPLGRAATAARQPATEKNSVTYPANYGKHADELGVGATWIDGNMFGEMVYAKS